MLVIAAKRLWSRPLLTLLSILGVALAVGLVASIPIFAQATSFAILLQEMRDASVRTSRPMFTARVYVLPTSKFPLSLAHTRELSVLIQDALTKEIGLPVLTLTRQIETTSLMLYPSGQASPYGPQDTWLGDVALAYVSGIAPHLTVVEGESMDAAAPSARSGGALDVWMHTAIADELGVQVGERYEMRDLRRGAVVPIRITGVWRATDTRDPYWHLDPNISLRHMLLVREADYEALAEPLFGAHLGFASWYLVLDEGQLAPERMRDYRDGLLAVAEILAQFLPDVGLDSTPLEALDVSLQRQADLTAILFAFSVPLLGCLFYFLSLISSIAVRWQRRETSVMVGRGLESRQAVWVGTLESTIVLGVGLPLGILCGTLLARAMGYTESFLSFTWREPIPVSALSLNVPMLVLTAGIALWSRLAPVVRAARTSVVEHERGRSRAHRKPFWQRFYLDVLLLVLVLYARDRLAARGSVVPLAVEDAGTTLAGSPGWIAALVRQLNSPLFRSQDPLVFLVPSLFALTLALLLVRFFPLFMWLGDGLGSLTRRVTLYLAFRQLTRQSHQYTQALLLIIVSLSLGAFMASMAVSLDQWLIDRVYYAIGSDVLLKQMPYQPPDPFEPPPPPTEGAWLYSPDVYTRIPGITHAARVAMYPVVMTYGDDGKQAGVYVGIDRLDLPKTLFFRADFASPPPGGASLGEMMNRLAQHRDGVLVSRRVFEKGDYELGDQIRLQINVVDEVLHEADFRIVGTYEYFPTVYEEQQAVEAARQEELAARRRGRRPSGSSCRTFSCLQERAMGKTAVIGNLQFLYDQIGATYLHYLWFTIDPDSDPQAIKVDIQNLKVYINFWLDTRDSIAAEMSRIERVGVFGVLTVGFLGAAALSGIGLMVYNYASLQERIFRFTVLRAVGLSLRQLVGQVGIEYLILMAYSTAGGAGIGALASKLYIGFFQAADANVLYPPTLLPQVAWEYIARISGVFVAVLVIAQAIVISTALRRGVFQALRMGDRE